MIAFLREMNPRSGRGELTVEGTRIDAKLAAKQHAALAEALEKSGARVEYVPALSGHPNGGIIAEAAVLLPQVAILAQPAFDVPPASIESVAHVLGQHRPIQSIVGPAALDGADVLRIGRTVYVAESRQTNADGIAQLRDIVRPFDYELRVTTIRDCPRLTAACSFVPPHFVIANPAWIETGGFGNLVVIPVDPKEPFGANTLTVGHTTLISSSFPRTEKRLREAGISTRRVEISEFEKAGGSLTQLCLVLEPRAAKLSADEIGLKPIQADGVPLPDRHTSQAIVHGGLVYVSPQPAFTPSAHQGTCPSVEEQTELAIRNVATILTSAGSSLARVLRATVYVAEPKQLPRINAVYDRMFGGHHPTRTVVTNGALPAGVLVEVEVVAALAESSV